MAIKRQKNKKVLIFSAVFAAVLVFSTGYAQASTITPETVIELVNRERVKNNLLPLEINEHLIQAAFDKATDMIKNNYFEHTSPQKITPWYWFQKNNYDYKYAGENLAINFISAEEQNNAWMQSRSHQDNILNTHYQETGVAVKQGVINGKNTILTVQEFGSRLDFVPVQPKKVEALAPKIQSVPAIKGSETPQVLADNSMPLDARYMDNFSKFLESNSGTLTSAVVLALISYFTILNFIILLYLAIEFGRKKTQIA